MVYAKPQRTAPKFSCMLTPMLSVLRFGFFFFYYLARVLLAFIKTSVLIQHTAITDYVSLNQINDLDENLLSGTSKKMDKHPFNEMSGI